MNNCKISETSLYSGQYGHINADGSDKNDTIVYGSTESNGSEPPRTRNAAVAAFNAAVDRSDLKRYFNSVENAAVLTTRVARLQQDVGMFVPANKMRAYMQTLLDSYQRVLVFNIATRSTLVCSFEDALEFLNNDFIRFHTETITGQIDSTIETASESNFTNNAVMVDGRNINNKDKFYNFTQLPGTRYDSDGNPYSVRMNTDEMTMEDWRNLNVDEPDRATQTSNRGFRDGNKFPWRQRVGLVKHVEKNNSEGLGSFRELTAPTYKQAGYLPLIHGHDRAIPGIME